MIFSTKYIPLPCTAVLLSSSPGRRGHSSVGEGEQGAKVLFKEGEGEKVEFKGGGGDTGEQGPE